ncbi:ras-related protein Rap-2c-like [Haliotis rufescens]|uniref:ras-related protein Rap-2c-like n=1 Tax=Haliotis rufescens TaxID=6454 RepID=UPI00201F2416|nr:ras-related protein Rap-2c-like [Haliotis rufescens]
MANRGKSFHVAGNQEKEENLCLVVLGASRVGKTTIISQFLDHNSITEYKGTFEEIHRCKYDSSGLDLTVEIVEIINGDAVPTVRKQAIAKGDAFVLVYSVDDADSFEQIYTLRDLILEEKKEINVPIYVVANKIDIAEERKTPIWQVADAIVTIDWEHKYSEVSAEHPSQIAELFGSVIAHAVSVYKERFVMQPRRMTTPAYLFSLMRKKLSARKQKSAF